VVDRANAGEFAAFHIDRAYYGLAEALKGQHRPTEALDAYNRCLQLKDSAPDVRLRALLGAGQMLDALDKRETALQQYRQIVVLEPDSEQASQARGYIKQPFKYPT
jgi:tetratricopeptide (TPR) repeat protein